MGQSSEPSRSHQRWAQFRFGVVGGLLAAPPPRGQLHEQIRQLAAKSWCHPLSGQTLQLGASTIERWYYAARNEKNHPVEVLQRKIRSDHGQHPALSSKLREALTAQHQLHPSWSYQLHADNLAVLVEKEPTL